MNKKKRLLFKLAILAVAFGVYFISTMFIHDKKTTDNILYGAMIVACIIIAFTSNGKMFL